MCAVMDIGGEVVVVGANGKFEFDGDESRSKPYFPGV